MRRLLFICIAFVCAVFTSYSQGTRKLSLESINSPAKKSTIESNAEIVMQEWHNGGASFVKYSADGKYVMSAGGEIKIWDVQSGLLIRTLPIKETVVDFSLDGKSILYSPKHGHFAVCDVLSGETVVTKNVGNSAVNPLYSKDGKYIIAVKDNEIQFWNAKTYLQEFSLEENQYKNWWEKAALSDDGHYLSVIAAPENDKMNYVANIVWDISARKKVSEVVFKEKITATAISDDNTFVACGSDKGTVYIRKTGSNQIENSFSADRLRVYDVSFAPDNKRLFVLGLNSGLSLYDFAAGKKDTAYFADEKNKDRVDSQSEWISFAPDKQAFAVARYSSISIRQMADGRKLNEIAGINGLKNLSFTLDGNLFMGTNKNHFLFNDRFEKMVLPDAFAKTYFHNYGVSNAGVFYTKLNGASWDILFYYDLAQDKESEVLTFTDWLDKIAVSENGAVVAFTTNNKEEKNRIYVFDTKKRKVIKSFQSKYDVSDFKLSPNGRFIGVSQYIGTTGTIIYDIETEKITDYEGFQHLSFSSKDTYAFLSGRKGDESYRGFIFNPGSGKVIRNTPNSLHVAFSSDEKYFAITSDDGAGHTVVQVENLASGAAIREIKTAEVYTALPQLLFSLDNANIIIRTHAGIVRCYSIVNGTLLTSSIANDAGDWLTYTPEGYFIGSDGGMKGFVHIVNGMDTIGIDQAYEALYRPDLVSAKLSGSTVSGSVLQQIMATGDAPEVQLGNLPNVSSDRNMAVSFSVTDKGGGVGYIYLSLNGKVYQLKSAEKAKIGESFTVSCDVTLANGENQIEAYATNAAGEIESRRSRAVVSWKGKTGLPNLYVLAVGINKYDANYVNPLKYAVPDTNAITEFFEKSTGSIYQNIYVTRMLDGDVTKAALSNTFSALSAKVQPDDVFLFYIAGHGTMYAGDYFFIPADFKARKENEIATMGVSKQFFVENLSKIKAQKSLILLDTCNSGSFVDRMAFDRLAHATGQAIVAASSDTQSALEGYQGHGVFTWAILQALAGKADLANTGTVSVTGLIGYVNNVVPSIAMQQWQKSQTPWTYFFREDFPLVGKSSARYAAVSSAGLDINTVRLVAKKEAGISSKEVVVVPQRTAPETTANTSSGSSYSVKRTTAAKESSAEETKHSRAKGVYVSLGASEGDFFDGSNISVEWFFLGGKHIFAGIDLNFIGTVLDDEAEEAAADGTGHDVDFAVANFVAGWSYNFGHLRPYVSAGMGFYNTTIHDAVDSAPRGFAMETSYGVDWVFRHFVVGASYRLHYLLGSGWIDNYLFSLGWTW